MQTKISSVAISSISFGDTLPISFRKVATARLQQTLTSLIKLKVSVCESCSQIRTNISGSFLKISRGIADDKYRRDVAKELNVKAHYCQSFLAKSLTNRWLNLAAFCRKAWHRALLIATVVHAQQGFGL
jgi:hypothetical protein